MAKYAKPDLDLSAVRGPDVARALGITLRHVNRLTRKGVLPSAKRGTFDLPACVQAYVRYVAHGGEGGEKVAGARERERLAEARIKEARALELEGRYLDADEVRDAFLAVGVRLAAGLDGAAGRMTDAIQALCGGDRPRIAATLAAEHRRLREELADGVEEICRQRRQIGRAA